MTVLATLTFHRWVRDGLMFGWYCRVPPKPWGPSCGSQAHGVMPVCNGCDRFLSDESVARCPVEIQPEWNSDLSIVAAWEDMQ